jgi:hypothetical protein
MNVSVDVVRQADGSEKLVLSGRCSEVRKFAKWLPAMFGCDFESLQVIAFFKAVSSVRGQFHFHDDQSFAECAAMN